MLKRGHGEGEQHDMGENMERENVMRENMI